MSSKSNTNKDKEVTINKDFFDKMTSLLHDIYTSGHCEKALNQISSSDETYYQRVQKIMKDLREQGL